MPTRQPIQTSQTSKGVEITVTLESFDGMPSAPSGARDITTEYADGKNVLRYTYGTDITYNIQGSCSQEPLATHPMFGPSGDYTIPADEWKNWKLWEADPNDPNLSGWKPDGDSVSDGMQKFYAYYNRGKTDFLLGTVTMRVTEEDEGSPNFANLGRITTPAGAPALPDGRNWLLVGIDAEQQVSVGTFKVTREYRASAAGGWDPDIYANT